MIATTNESNLTTDSVVVNTRTVKIGEGSIKMVTEGYCLSIIGAMKTPEKIAWLCKDRGITQKRVGELARLPENRISKWLDGQGEPTARQALRVAQVLKVPVEWLIDDEADVPPPLPELTGPELRAVEIVRALKIDTNEVIRRLYGKNVCPESGSGTEASRSTIRTRDRTDTLNGLVRDPAEERLP